MTAPPLAPAEQVDQDINGLLKRDATWLAPDSLKIDETTNIALSIGDVQSLRNEIAGLVPTVEARPSQPVTIGSVVRVQLTSDSSDASVTPLEAIDNSIGEQTSMLFSWQVHPHKAGELNLIAHIQFPLSHAGLRDQLVPLRIPVHNTAKHIFLSIVQNFWTQVAAVVSVVGTAVKLAWGWYTRRRASLPAEPAAQEPTDQQAQAPEAETSPTASGQTPVAVATDSHPVNQTPPGGP
ncbi:hypothetical protein [Mycolicibacterium sp.]|uniref:hypothetical protein n=1 Tax=Mycolicibacterium sp. TaxID=2320850 RepID=UPI0037CA3080